MLTSQIGAIAIRLAENNVAFEHRNRRIFVLGSTLENLKSMFPMCTFTEHSGSIEIL